jgi:hypothetical protein
MLSEKDILPWQEHYRDLLREAEQERLARQALAGKKHVRFNERALAWLGGYFVAWGCYLQRRYAFGIAEGNVAASFDPAEVTPDCGCTT